MLCRGQSNCSRTPVLSLIVEDGTACSFAWYWYRRPKYLQAVESQVSWYLSYFTNTLALAVFPFLVMCRQARDGALGIHPDSPGENGTCIPKPSRIQQQDAIDATPNAVSHLHSRFPATICRRSLSHVRGGGSGMVPMAERGIRIAPREDLI